MANNVIFYKKKSKETLKKKSLYYVNSAPELRNDQKSPKNGSLNRDLLNFFKSMVNFRCFLVKAHVQAIQNMCGKGV